MDFYVAPLTKHTTLVSHCLTHKYLFYFFTLLSPPALLCASALCRFSCVPSNYLCASRIWTPARTQKQGIERWRRSNFTGIAAQHLDVLRAWHGLRGLTRKRAGVRHRVGCPDPHLFDAPSQGSSSRVTPSGTFFHSRGRRYELCSLVLCAPPRPQTLPCQGEGGEGADCLWPRGNT